MLDILIFMFSTALCSAVHGSGSEKKPVIVASHVLMIGTVCGSIYVIFAGLWWALFRRGWQARAEMDYMQAKISREEMEKAYPWPIGIGAALIADYCKTRRQQEFCIGLYTSFLLSLIPTLITAIV